MEYTGEKALENCTKPGVRRSEEERMEAGAEVTKSFCIFQYNFVHRIYVKRTSTKAEINRDSKMEIEFGLEKKSGGDNIFLFFGEQLLPGA